MKRFRFVSGVVSLALVALIASARAETPVDAASDAAGSDVPAKSVKHPKKVAQKKKRRGEREKETEGTEAPDRFQADTVIKSQYKLHGEPLEVDPD